MVKVVKGVPAGWGVCSRTMILNSYVRALSHHNNSIAVGSGSRDIIILNAITGTQSAILSGHTDQVACVVFSSDGASLVSGSQDQTVKLWDTQTGGVVKTFHGHKATVWSVSISADSTTIASGCNYSTICLWSIQTGECYHTIKQPDSVNHVMFSPKNPQHLISISDHKVWQWDSNGSQIRPPFDGSHADFSLDGAQLVSCFDKTVTVRNSESGEVVTGFQAVGSVYQCSFSPDNRIVAVAPGSTVYCWGITTSEPQLVETFIGHTHQVTSLVFCSSTTLVSASGDKSVKFWQIGAQSTDPPIVDLRPSAPIKSVTLKSQEGIAITNDSEGIIKTWDISTGICKASIQTLARDPDGSDIQLVNGRVVLVWCVDKKMHAWDTENGELPWQVDAPEPILEAIKISEDGFRVFVLYTFSFWAWSLQTGEVLGKMTFLWQGSLGSLIVDGSKVWAYWSESNYKGWDFGIQGSTSVKLHKKHKPPSLNKLWDPKKARFKNPATGEVIFQLSGGFANPVCAQCDDSHLVAGYQSGEVLILDLTNVK